MTIIKKGMTTTFVALAMAATALTAAPAFAAGKMTISSPQDPGSWDPIDTFLVQWAAVATNIFDGLTYRGPDLKVVPGLAESWEELDEGKRIRFKLRQNVKFHNGEPFNAAAVKFTFERLLGEQGAKGPQRSNYVAIESVDVIDDYTVDMKLKAPDPVLLTKLAGYGGMIVPPKYIQEKGEDNFNLNPIGTGAFKFVSYAPKTNIKLEANPDYWGGAPKLSELEYRFIAEPATAVAELQAGRVDLVIPPTIPIGMIPVIEGDSKLEIVSVPGPTVDALRFNTRDGITADPKVRKAIIMAVDRGTIVKSILAGQASEIASFQSALSFGYDADLKPLPYDPEGAKKLLAEAGVKPGAALQIDIRGNDATMNEVAQVISSYLSMVGITATIKPYETNVLLNDIIPQGKTGAMFQQKWGGWTFDYDNTAYSMYHSGEKWNPYDKDEKLDKLLESQRPLTDRAEREKILKEIGSYTAERALEIPLYNTNAIYGINKRVKGFIAPPDNRLKLTDVTVE
ncbi:ABC transporter substrate-binding protein [Agrobacterium genomosp. 3]|uniref:ABC transporter substrate-binding protein n=1 Tax=Rhizobium/Agrobacterium group TaxID=227290 RepID=UPI00062A35C0|nr:MULTISPECIES: ABC transporter substrate-binding protein [Rhizobium/Agrobacterium group]MBP8937110.1 ABC transporter substrate-binding protein [Agrobacterium sp.]MCA1865364.1 ABC transporter substrate-binding protein [Agrobacterium tomkonis]MCA1875421.1 ABC transporter substrate-binding protein [Agrobacterium tumefaciens]KRA69279.1 peptide ABC transporter substrate-binding protein [Rhizobium sp. Root651]MCA1891631.1 ABC transporter substrate-binding protein [Agrobacterium tomkonis]